MSCDENRLNYIKGLNQLASLLENNPEIPLPYTGSEGGSSILVFPTTDSEFYASTKYVGVGGVSELTLDEESKAEFKVVLCGGLHLNIMRIDS